MINKHNFNFIFQFMSLFIVEDDSNVIFKNTIIKSTKTFSHAWTYSLIKFIMETTHPTISQICFCQAGNSFQMSKRLLKIYKGLIRPCFDYWSHVWGWLFFYLSPWPGGVKNILTNQRTYLHHSRTILIVAPWYYLSHHLLQVLFLSVLGGT